jgi:hypothetical protein
LRVACGGAPRDLGLEQGRACREAIRAAARRLGLGMPSGPWAALARLGAARRDPASPACAPLARDLARHFPHLHERTLGLAAGSGVPEPTALALLEAGLADATVPRVRVGAAEAADPSGAEGPALRLELAMPSAADLLVREVRPDGGYRTLDLARPGLVAALAGVNEHGLAAVGASLSFPAGDDRCRAPGFLLLQGSIERLDRVEKALEWCERRPGGGRALLLFADAAGACAALEIEGEKRRRVALPGPGPRASGEVACVTLHARARALELALPGAEPVRLALDPAS